MKVGGIVILIFGILNFLIAIIGIIKEPQYASQIGSQFSIGIMFIVLGTFMISRANKKKLENKEKDKWIKGE